MSTSYHGDEETIKRFLDQGLGTAKPSFPDGMCSEDDEGELAFAVITDHKNKIIRIDFNKPVTWLGLDLASAERLVGILNERIGEL